MRVTAIIHTFHLDECVSSISLGIDKDYRHIDITKTDTNRWQDPSRRGRLSEMLESDVCRYIDLHVHAEQSSMPVTLLSSKGIISTWVASSDLDPFTVSGLHTITTVIFRHDVVNSNRVC